MGRAKRKRTVHPAPKPRGIIPDLDAIAAKVAAESFWHERTSVPLDGRRRR